MDTLTIAAGPASPYFNADVYVAIRPDGTVDSALTREWTISGEWPFEDGKGLRADAMDLLRRWRFSPPMAGDTAVRAAHSLTIAFPAGPDSVPATAQLHYVMGPMRDTLRLVWTRQPMLAPGPVREQATALLVAMAQLRVTRTYGEPSPWTGCFTLAPKMAEREALAVDLTARGAMMQATPHCASLEPWRAVEFTRIFRLDDRTWVVRFTRPSVRFYGGAATCRVEQTTVRWRAACG